MAVSPELCAHVRDQLAGFAAVAVRRMFGGAGLFAEGMMFGLVAGDTVYLKVDAVSRPAFEAAGMGPFRYGTSRGETVIGSYYELPAEVLDDAERFCESAGQALAAARQAAADKPKRRRARR